MRKKLLWLLVLVIIVSMVGTFSFAGCKEEVVEEEAEEAAEEASAEEEAKVVAEEPFATVMVIVKSMENPFWDAMIEGAKKCGEDLNMAIEDFAPVVGYDVEEQISFMEQGIVKGIDGIAIAPGDSEGIIPGIEKADAAGIIVTTLSSDAFGGPVTSWAGSPNYDSAYNVGEYVMTQLGDGAKIVVLEGKAANEVAIERDRGFKDAVEDSDKNAEILTSQTANFNAVEGQEVMENLLVQFPEIDAVLCANDEMALGALAAIEEAGRLDEIMIAGYDGNSATKQNIKDGKILATADQTPGAQGYWGVLAIYMAVKGYPCPRKLYVPAPVITIDNVGEPAEWW